MVLFIGAAIWFGTVSSSEINQASAANGAVVLSEDPVAGHITVETDTIKGVWHYKTLGSENFNQGGGSLYELYHKPTDPGTTRNLVAYPDFFGWGNGQSTSVWVGVGGVGSTTLYSADAPPGPYETSGFADVLGDNNLSGILVSHSATVDGQGNAILTFHYRVHNQSNGKEWYEVVKQWTVQTDGTIGLEVNWSILNSGYFAEPALRTNWSKRVGWDRFVKYGHDWNQPSYNKYYLGTSNIEDESCWDYMNRFVPDWIAYTGSSSAPTIVMMPDYSGGFADSGSYQLGVRSWGSKFNPVQEECSLQSPYIGAHVINWMAAWGGNPPKGNRYAWLAAGTSWSDRYRIELSDGLPISSIDISSVNIQSINGISANISWVTNMDTDAVVEVSTNPNNASSWHVVGSDNTTSRNHLVTANGLVPGTIYMFRVKSANSSGEMATSGGYTYSSAEPSFVLTIRNREIYWRNLFDYRNRMLSVEFNVNNQGSSRVDNVQVDSVYNTSGVFTNNQLPIAIGNVEAGSSAPFTIVYAIPVNVQNFRTQILGSASGPNGETINFP